MPSPSTVARAALTAALVVLGTACAGDEASQDMPATIVPVDPDPDPVTLTRAPDESPSTGTMSFSLGDDGPTDLVIQTCRLERASNPAFTEAIRLSASGADERGRRITVDASRFLTAGAATTVTDTVDYELWSADGATVLQRFQAQRVEVAGVVEDPRDPDARSSLLTIDGTTVGAEGIFAAPGAFVDDGYLVEGAFVAACPA